MAKVLNLDQILQTEVRTLVLKGITYPITEMSVQDYIEATKAAQSLKDNDDTELQMKETARLIARQVTGIDVSFLLTLSVERLFAIAEFVRGVDPEEIVRRAEAANKPVVSNAVAAEATPGN